MGLTFVLGLAVQVWFGVKAPKCVCLGGCLGHQLLHPREIFLCTSVPAGADVVAVSWSRRPFVKQLCQHQWEFVEQSEDGVGGHNPILPSSTPEGQSMSELCSAREPLMSTQTAQGLKVLNSVSNTSV